MQTNRVKKILREGGLALGTYTGGIADPQIVEIIGHAGYDAAFIDMEHTSFDLRDIQLMVMAAERVGITPIVRTPGFDPAFILRLLDMGVQGIQVPHINDARAAREAVKAVRYAPLGERGMAGASRASDYGNIPVTYKSLGNGAIKRSDKAGWYFQETVTAKSPKVTSVLVLTVAVFDLGDGTAVAYVSDIPTNRPDLRTTEGQVYKGINVG